MFNSAAHLLLKVTHMQLLLTLTPSRVSSKTLKFFCICLKVCVECVQTIDHLHQCDIALQLSLLYVHTTMQPSLFIRLKQQRWNFPHIIFTVAMITRWFQLATEENLVLGALLKRRLSPLTVKLPCFTKDEFKWAILSGGE